jgi:hypothetical protein
MEFIHMHGEFDDVPYAQVIDGIKQAHPRLFASSTTTTAGSLDVEAAAPAATSRPKSSR